MFLLIEETNYRILRDLKDSKLWGLIYCLLFSGLCKGILLGLDLYLGIRINMKLKTDFAVFYTSYASFIFVYAHSETK